jgi:hypothetical protein
MLGGEHDRANAIVTIHPGGTESQDWAEMLMRMYLKWAERRGFKREIIGYQPAEEAGIKSATFHAEWRIRVRAEIVRKGEHLSFRQWAELFLEHYSKPPLRTPKTHESNIAVSCTW